MSETNTLNLIGLNDVLGILGVSPATIKNWIKHNYITFQEKQGGQVFFNYQEINRLKDKINTGEVERLNGRANKRGSIKTFIPLEYVDNLDVLSEIQGIVDFIQQRRLSVDAALFVLSLNLLRETGLLKATNFSDAVKFGNKFFRHSNLELEIQYWFKKINRLEVESGYSDLFLLEIPKINDVLGVIYQSLSSEGNKAKKGSYYTPKRVVADIVNIYLKDNGEAALVLDPCCGTGQFLLSASEIIKNPEHVWGFDIDPVAVQIAKINLFIKFKELDFIPRVFEKNSLLDENDGTLFCKSDVPKFDLIITNPPWGVHFGRQETLELRRKFHQIKSRESFAYFIKAGLNFLKKDGILSFILPESILNIKVHQDIREIILRETQILSVSHLSRVFKNVFTPVIRLDLKNHIPHKDSELTATKGKETFKIIQNRFLGNTDRVFDIFSKDMDLEIIGKAYRLKHTTLKNQADWALGIVTGNNEKFLSAERLSGFEPVFTGKEVERFGFKKEQNYIHFDSDKFQQAAPEFKYRAREKLIYKFISKYLVFAYDDKQRLTLNSANILIPKIEGYPIKVILALFNSALYQFIFEKKIHAIKLLRSDIEKLPLPLWENDIFGGIINQVDLLLGSNRNSGEKLEAYRGLDNYIMRQFGLSEKEISYIKSNISISPKLLFN